MYYQNYDDYMRDVFYFNQMPNQNINYPYMGYNAHNPQFQSNNLNSNFYNNSNSDSNINNMYPSIYRIVQPVVSRVVTGSNYGYMNEDNLNSMVDTVYNIVEGDALSTSIENDTNSNTTTNASQTSTSNQRNTTNCNTQNTSNSNNNTSIRNNENNQSSKNLLRDLIKILLIKEIINRNNIRRFNNNFNNYQNMPNCYDQRYVF